MYCDGLFTEKERSGRVRDFRVWNQYYYGTPESDFRVKSH